MDQLLPVTRLSRPPSQPFPFFFCWLFVGGGGDFGSGSGSKFNCAARVGSGQTISGTGRVRASVLSPCRPLDRPINLKLGVFN